MSGHKPFKDLTDKMSDESKARVAALTRDVNETIRARAEHDPEFRMALAEEAAPEMLELLQGILGAHHMHEVILTAGYEKRIRAVIAKATGL